MNYVADPAEILSAIATIAPNDQIIELRALQVPGSDGFRKNYTGFFTDLPKFAEEAAKLSDAGAKGVYFTPNPVKETPKVAPLNQVRVAARGSSSTDDDIDNVNWLLVDIDPCRASGTSATDAEKAAARRVCGHVSKYLQGLGWPNPLIGDSGNGYHLMYRLDGGTAELNRVILDSLSFLFSTDEAKVDQLVFNPSRIWKVYGTWPRKGDNSAQRPYRKAALLNPTQVITPVSKQQQEAFADVLPTDAPLDGNRGNAEELNQWVETHFPSAEGPDQWAGRGRRWVFDVCPWDPNHIDRSAYVVQFNSGAIAAGCLHTSCKGHGKDNNGHTVGWKRLQKLAGTPFTPVALTAVATTASSTGSPNLTDLGNAKRLIHLFQTTLLFCPTHGAWYVYDDSRWKHDLDGAVARYAKATVGTIFDEAAVETDPGRQTNLRRHALRSESSRALSAMVSLASTELEVAIKSERLDADPWLFNVQNGTLDLKTGQIHDHDRTDYITKLSNITYDPKAECPLWDEFLSYVMEEDQEVVEFIHRFFGYCLSGLVTEQVLLFMEGTGGNGKTTALLMIMHVLGDYAIQGAPGLLLAKRNESHPTEVADLEGTRFVANSEVEKGKPFAESLIKQLTGSDKIRARRMRQDFYEFEPTHKLCIAANHRPIIKGNDEGIWRRVIRIPWNVQISPEKKDPFFLDKLKKESPGILRRLVEGCLEWQQHGLNPPEKVLVATEEYREEMDVLSDFMEELCIIGESHRIAQKELYLAYVDWCEELKQKPQNYRLFNRQLKERDYKTITTSVNGSALRVWQGISLRKDRARMTGFMQLRVADA
jgi:P4 family phage/plasmid primase-like protien